MATFLTDPTEQLAQVDLIAGAEYATYQIRLLKAVIPFSPPPDLAALILLEADFTGYLAVGQTGPPAAYPDEVQGGISLTVPNSNFTVGPTPTTFNNIYGFWVSFPDPTPTKLVFTCLFSQYVAMQAVGDQLNLQFTLNFFGAGGILVTVNGRLV